MSLVIANSPVPLKTDVDGVVRVGNTRVILDTVIAEEIVSQYPTLNLADVYAVIGYYLQHQSEIEAYLRQRRQIANKVCKQNEMHFNQKGIRKSLLARRAK